MNLSYLQNKGILHYMGWGTEIPDSLISIHILSWQKES